uniref:amino acid kinase family protein n=1 Tax=Actinomadura fibrosa TaxID=111802 RepID=UPI003F97F7D6
MGVVVVKCGGAVPAEAVCADLAGLAGRAVLVHGGGPDIDRLARELGVPARTLVSPSGVTSRHTDPAMLDAVTLALTGRVKPRLLRALAAADERPVHHQRDRHPEDQLDRDADDGDDGGHL